MNTATRRIFDAVLAAMQPAEEIGGPDSSEYDELMRRISNEARRRAADARAARRSPSAASLGTAPTEAPPDGENAS